MGKHNTLSGVIVLIVILMIAATTLAVVNYTTNVLGAAVAFASTDQIDKVQACGVTLPAELFKLKYDIPNMLLPAIYAGLPALMILIAILMFVAGHYYGNEKEGHSSSETTVTTSSPNRSSSGKYKPGRRVEQTQTQRSSRSERT
ncbi:MAG TPA: hypothetical protein VJB68_03220 [Methylophilaceae bacterium]|nr:hypothetical protein [Methylophilaceae bacterium]